MLRKRHINLVAGELVRDKANDFALYEFHILKEIRDHYSFDETLFSSNGNVIFANFHAVRVFTQKLNERRDPARRVKAGNINAMGLVDEIYHVLLRTYEEQENPRVFSRAVEHTTKNLGKSTVSKIVKTFSSLFPPIDVYRGNLSLDQYLEKSTGGKTHVESTVEEIILLYFANSNPAFSPFKELFNDEQLIKSTDYRTLIVELERFFQIEKPIGPDKQFLFDFLRAPILASPNSLEGQLEFIRKRWGVLLSHKYLERILGSEDFIKEENKIIVHDIGPPPLVVPHYPVHGKDSIEQYETERYSKDVEWMPRVVLLAKNTYVWLDQLSRKYGRSIANLDQIPDEELDQLARWNFTGLWLIGIWERSPASQKIKQMTGNPEAVSSAYSLYEYEIARDIGGEEAFHNLSHRAWQRGIRLAGDMVPNHMGLYSKWVIGHPEYFVQSSYSPFPNYKFTGPNLSDHPAIHLRIEDGYWNRSDASVVFQRIDTSTGDVRYLYHGNDGTHMPWNDTAQLDFLKTEVREAVIGAIFHVARKFPIIRFDAAMTLTKKHFQRLWYPQPGTGGDIPSRADHAMTKEEFDRLFPNEFWREVVDRINQEMPGTLLLAEAFWLLEGFFVRTLGMHRVYNSAFMHMLMKEENAKYRELIKNTLAYDPEILKRYVNFMSNPDERTAIDQFGKDGKYFGVAMLMVTLPGLPMFGHGQIEGYTEKYGMEYKKAYYNESPDEGLVHRHEWEIFPLMSKRYLFSQVTDFDFFDVYDEHGVVNENVFAYSNKTENERALIFYNNKFADCRGWIKQSCVKAVSVDGTAEKRTVSCSAAEALQLKNDERCFYLFREHRTKLEYIRSGKEIHERGFLVELKAFEYKLFMDFKEVYDSAGDYERISYLLQGNGVPDVKQALKEMKLKPIHENMVDCINQAALFLSSKEDHKQHSLDLIVEQFRLVLNQIDTYLSTPSVSSASSVVNEFQRRLVASRNLYCHIASNADVVEKYFVISDDSKPSRDIVMIASWLMISSLGSFTMETNHQWIDELQLTKVLDQIFAGEAQSDSPIDLIKIIISNRNVLSASEPAFFARSLVSLLDERTVQEYLRVNAYNEIVFYNKERFEELVRWAFIFDLIERITIGGVTPKKLEQLTLATSTSIRKAKEMSLKTSFQLGELKEMLKHELPEATVK
jgi:glycosidase